MGGKDITAIFRTRHPFKPGQDISLLPNKDAVHVFDRETGKRLS
jgi:multiple sugar transport system ATP-binding protein